MAPAPSDELGYKPLDGGWGWVVVVAAHISIGFAYATPKALSIFFHEIQIDLDASYSDIAWISSIMLAVMYAGGPISSVLVNRFGSRPVVILGGLMCWISMVMASFGTSIYFLFFSIGVIGGFGLALNLNASLTILSQYFLEKRPLANGLAMAGSPVFLSFLAPLNQYLLDRYGWRGSHLILGALMLNCCVAGALMRPVAVSRKLSSGAQKKDVEEQPETTSLKGSCTKNMKRFLDFSLFRDRGFVFYLIGSMMFIFGAYAPIVFLSAYAISKGVDEYSAAYLLSIMGFVDMFIRPGTGLVANCKWIRPRVQYFFSFAMVFNGTCHLLCPLMTTYTLLVVYTVLFGIGFGMVFALIFECLMDLMGSQRFPGAVGLVTIMECFPMLLGPPAAAFLVDIFDDYNYLFLMCGAVIVSGGLFLFATNIYYYRMLEKEKKDEDSEKDNNVSILDLATISLAMVQQAQSHDSLSTEQTNPPVKVENGPHEVPVCAEEAEQAY